MRNSVNHTGGVTYDQIFRAIGDPHRLQILALLREKELSAGEILATLDVVQSTLSHHMKTLVDAGVVTAVRHGKWTYYSLNAAVLSQAELFLQEYAKGTKEPAAIGGKDASSAQETARVQGAVPAAAKTVQHEAAENSAKAAEGSSDAAGGSEVKEDVLQKEGKKKSKKGKKNKKNKK